MFDTIKTDAFCKILFSFFGAQRGGMVSVSLYTYPFVPMLIFKKRFIISTVSSSTCFIIWSGSNSYLKFGSDYLVLIFFP